MKEYSEVSEFTQQTIFLLRWKYVEFVPTFSNLYFCSAKLDEGREKISLCAKSVFQGTKNDALIGKHFIFQGTNSLRLSY